MPQTDWKRIKHSGDNRRRDTKPVFDFDTLMEATRARLNAIAASYGITDAEALPNKRAVVEAIRNA